VVELSKKTIAVALALGLIGGAMMGSAEAAKRKKKPVQVDQQMFLVGDGCDADVRGISLTDTADVHTCAYFEGGALAEFGEPALSAAGRAVWIEWPALDGVPLKLDTSKPITGEIYTHGIFPLVGDFPGVAAGNAKLTVQLVGETGGEEKVIGEFVEEFLATPSPTPHLSNVEITPDAALSGVEFTTLRLRTRIGGASAGQVFYKLDNPNSFISIPTFV
jgi:hypothetical protein